MEQTESENTTTPAQSVAIASFPLFKFVLILGGFVFLIAGVVGGMYLRNKSQAPSTNQQTQSPSVTVPIQPTIVEDEMKDWQTYTFKDNQVSFRYPRSLNLLYFPTDTTGKIETDRMASTENAVLKNGEKKVLGINPNQIGMSFPSEQKYTEEFLSVNGNKVLIAGVPIKKFKSIDGSYFSLIKYLDKIILSSCFSEEKLCDQILSTFKFSDTQQTTSSENILDVLKQWTVPMVWSDKKSDTATYRLENNNDINLKGVSIVSTVKDKAENKIGSLTSSEDTNLKSEGWIQDENNSAGGVEGLNFAYKKDISGKRSVFIISQRAGENGQGMKFTAFMSDEFTP